MAGENDPSLTETPDGRIVVLFMTFVAVTYLFDKLTDWVDHYLKHHNRRGLLHTIHKLEEELLALGLISLLLIGLEDYIVRICVDSSGDGGKTLKKLSKDKSKTGHEEMHTDFTSNGETEAVLSEELEDHANEHEDDVLVGGDNEDEELLTDETLLDDLSGRRLLGGVTRMLLAGGGGSSGVCGKGEESFWSIRTLHQTHLFIFVLAVVHIVFAGLSMVLCSWKVNQWKKWEEYRDDDLTKVDYSHISDNHNFIVHYGRAFFAQFHQHIDKSVYLSFRRLFIERMELDNDFEFHKFLVNSMEEEFSRVVKLEWVMWVVAAVWIATSASVVYIMTAVGILLTLLAGTELESIALKLGNDAYVVYSGKPAPGVNKKEGKGIVKKIGKISMGISNMLTGTAKAERQQLELAKRTFKGLDPSRILYTAETDTRAKGQTSPQSWDYTQNQFRDSRDSGMGHDSVYSVSPHGCPEISYAQRSASDSGRQQLPPDAMGVYDQLTSRSIDIVSTGEANQPPKAPRRQSSLAKFAGGSTSFLKKLGTCLFCCADPGDDLAAMRTRTFSASYKVNDSANLFPFKKPRVMLRIFQYTYFETSLIMAVLLFNIWQEVDPDFIKSPDSASFLMVAVGTIVMVLTSIFLLPVYWLTMVVGSHCPSKVLKKAKKKNVHPQVVNALEEVSMTLKKTSANIARTSMGMNRQSMGIARMSLTKSACDDTSSIPQEQPEPGFPTHWADVEAMAPVQQAEKVKESDDKPSSGALGMLVGAMLKNKKKELENLAGSNVVEQHGPVLERKSYSGINTGPPSLGRKSRPLLHRISVPTTLPDIQEVQSPHNSGKGPEGELSSLSRTVTRGSLGRSASLSATEQISLTGLHDIREGGSPIGGKESYVLGGKKMMRKSKSELDLPKEASPRGVQSTDGSAFLRPSLSRGSMPLTKVIGRKHKAYLERERRNAEHMMQENPDEEEPEECGENADCPGEGSSGPSGSTAGGSCFGSTSDQASAKKDSNIAMAGIHVVSSLPSSSDRVSSVNSGVVRSTLDHVAELSKVGEKQKHQRM